MPDILLTLKAVKILKTKNRKINNKGSNKNSKGIFIDKCADIRTNASEKGGVGKWGGESGEWAG